MATVASNSHMSVQAYSVMTNVHTSDPIHELPTAYACAGMPTGYGVVAVIVPRTTPNDSREPQP